MTPSAVAADQEVADAKVAAQKAANGETLRIERLRQRLSQTEVADVAGTGQKVVSRAENGKASMESQHRIAAALGIDLAGA